MARKPTPAPKKPKLDGYRDTIILDRSPEADDEETGPVPLKDMDVLDMAEEMKRELDRVPYGPLRYVIDQAFDQARQANLALIKCDAFDAITVGRLQVEVRRFYDLLRWVNSTLESGRIIERRHTAEQIDEARQMLNEAGYGD